MLTTYRRNSSSLRTLQGPAASIRTVVAPPSWVSFGGRWYVPAEVGAALRSLPRSPEAMLLVRKVPVGSPPATPPHPLVPTDKDPVSEVVLDALARQLGTPVGYAPEQGGDRVQNLVPTREGAARQVSTSSSVLLELHTEAAFHPFRPDFLLLLCLRGDPGAGTTYATADAIAALLHQSILQTLAQPRFTTGIDESYIDGGAAAAWRTEAHPVLWQGEDGRWFCRFDAALTQGLDADASAALAAMGAAARCALRTVVLATGDLLVIDNARVVHGRTPYEPRFDGSDRWLQRSLVVRSFDEVPSAECSGHVITTRFA